MAKNGQATPPSDVFASGGGAILQIGDQMTQWHPKDNQTNIPAATGTSREKDNYKNPWMADNGIQLNVGYSDPKLPPLISGDGKPYCLIRHDRTYPHRTRLIGYYNTFDEIRHVQRAEHHLYRVYLNGSEIDCPPFVPE